MNTATWTRFWNRNLEQIKPVGEVLLEQSSSRYPFTVISPKVLEWAKNHFQCSTLKGLPLENGGSESTAGAHWDKLIVGNDMMNPSDFFNIVNSGLNLALMEDYGHFKANYSMEEHLSWGYHVGCGAFSEDCSQVPMTCPESGKNFCSPDYFSMGICLSDQLAESCNVFHEEVFSDCRHFGNKEDYTQSTATSLMYFGPEGRCLMGKISSDQTNERGNCLKIECGNQKVSITVSIENADNKILECLEGEEGQRKNILEDGSLYITCPKVPEICREELNCLNDCNGNGRCLKNGQCWCYFGYQGEECSVEVEGEYPFLIAGGKFSFFYFWFGLLILGFFVWV